MPEATRAGARPNLLRLAGYGALAALVTLIVAAIALALFFAGAGFARDLLRRAETRPG